MFSIRDHQGHVHLVGAQSSIELLKVAVRNDGAIRPLRNVSTNEGYKEDHALHLRGPNSTHEPYLFVGTRPECECALDELYRALYDKHGGYSFVRIDAIDAIDQDLRQRLLPFVRRLVAGGLRQLESDGANPRIETLQEAMGNVRAIFDRIELSLGAAPDQKDWHTHKLVEQMILVLDCISASTDAASHMVEAIALRNLAREQHLDAH